MIFLLDNYDSFTFNLVQRIGEINPTADIRVERNDQITLEQIEALYSGGSGPFSRSHCPFWSEVASAGSLSGSSVSG